MKLKCGHIRTEEELQQAFAVRREVFVDEQKVPIEEEMDAFDTLTATCRHYLATVDGVPVGAARWREYEPGTAKLQRIAVVRPWRGQGIGQRLVEAMELDATTLGYRRAVLDAQTAAERFYRKLGYATETTAPFLDAGIPHVRMSKRL